MGGGLVLVGWALDVAALKGPLTGPATMKANTAAAFLLAGISLWLATGRPRHRRVSLVLGAVVALLGALTLSEDIGGWDLGIDQLLFRDTAPLSTSAPGRMAPMTAVSFSAFGAGRLVAANRRHPELAHLLALLATMIPVLALIGYLYEASSLYGVGLYATMAVHTAAQLFVLGVGLLCANPGIGVMSVVVRDGFDGMAVRQVLPWAIAAPIVVGWLRLRGQSAGLYGNEFGVSLMVLSTILILAVVIWWNASSIARMEAAQRRAQDELLLHEQHTRFILDKALDAVISMNAAGVITYWNRRAEAIFGWSSAEALDHDLAELVMPPRYRAAHKHGLERFLSTGEGPILGRRIEITGLRRDGAEFPIELAVTALLWRDAYSFNAFVADITDRKQAEEALRNSEQQKSSLLLLAGRLEQAHTYSEVLEAALEEVRAIMGYRSVWAYLLSHDKAHAVLVTIQGEMADKVERTIPMLQVKGDRMMEEIFSSHGPVVVEDARTDPRTDKEIVSRLQNRTIINIPLSLGDRRIGALGTGSFGPEGVKVPDKAQLDYFSAVATQLAHTFDRIQFVTQREHAEERIRALNRDLERRVAERTTELEAAVEDLEAFSYSVSHDLRAPLRQIDGFSKLLLDDCTAGLKPDGQRYVTVIRDGTQKMGQMIDDLLNLSRIDRQPLKWVDTDLNTIVREVVEDISHDLTGRNIEWNVGTLPIAQCDPGLIRLVFTNLISNAVKYTRLRERARITIDFRQGSDGPLVAVQDNGAGFDQRYADKLFGVFQRLHRMEDFEGTGIGLATVHRILRKLGGRIWAEGEVDRGATFFFTFRTLMARSTAVIAAPEDGDEHGTA